MSLPDQTPARTRDVADLAARYCRVRALSEALCEPLEPEDFGLQSMPDASPPRWHLAHTTWFFEHFVLGTHLPGYRVFHPRFGYLFNSYYESVGSFHPRPRRGALSRPTTREVLDWRHHADGAVQHLLQGADSEVWQAVGPLIELGLHHEQQHQELLLMDLKHHLGTQPLQPAYRTDLPTPPAGEAPAVRWLTGAEGVHSIGHAGDGFAFDNETPRHRVHLAPHLLASRPVTNGEWLTFIEDGGYDAATLWLSDGWAARHAQGWQAPLYWRRDGGEWLRYTLGGVRPLDLAAPVMHVSFYEADAFARWAGARLPTEAEWECAAPAMAEDGNFLETGFLEPAPAADIQALTQMHGEVWEWTGSPYVPYPGYRPPAGALGEYNGKFMANQMVLRGGCCLTPADHVRSTYRNFYPPDARWPCAGLRLARDA